MNGARLGSKYCELPSKTFHTVVPWPPGLSGPAHWNAAPPQDWTGMPRCFWYQARSASGLADLMKMPPTPVTLFIFSLPWGGSLTESAGAAGLGAVAHGLPREREQRAVLDPEFIAGRVAVFCAGCGLGAPQGQYLACDRHSLGVLVRKLGRHRDVITLKGGLWRRARGRAAAGSADQRRDAEEHATDAHQEPPQVDS